jgi:hypothetical protein
VIAHTIGTTAAIITIKPHDNGTRIEATIGCADDRTIDPDNSGSEWRPTTLMERASLALEQANAKGNEPSTNALQEMFAGKKIHKINAIDYLVQDGYATRDDRKIRSLKPYRNSPAPEAGQ